MQLIARHAAALLLVQVILCGFSEESRADGGEEHTRDVSSQTQSQNEDLPVKYWGNLFSLKFHRPSCPFAKAMNPHNLVFFNFRRQAVDSGQVPCRYCLPPTWNTVHAQVLNPSALKSTSTASSAQTTVMPEESMPVPEKSSLQREITVTH